MNGEEKWVQQLPRRAYKDPVHGYESVASMPPNTLTNADGTAREKVQETLAIMEEKLEFHSDLHGTQLEHACTLLRDALQLM